MNRAADEAPQDSQVWLVELNDKVIGELRDPVWDHEGQFWYQYRICPTAGAELIQEAFWQEQGHTLVFVDPPTQSRITDAIPGKFFLDDKGEAWISMRGLRVAPTNVAWRERLHRIRKALFG